MYTKRDTVYAEPYKVLKAGNVYSPSMPSTTEGVEEVDAPTDDLRVEGGLARWARGLMGTLVKDGADYAYYKTRLIKSRYSNDDQLAIMLNGDDEEYRRMQAWRQWAADVAHRIVEQTTGQTDLQ